MEDKLVLVIDDDESVCTLLKLKLEKLGAKVEYANRGKTGLAKAAEIKPDLIVLDFNMPDIDGGDVKTRLKSDPATADIPVVILTSLLTEKEARARGKQTGGQEMISKHLGVPEIVDRIMELLNGL